jgi:hypothetical protein
MIPFQNYIRQSRPPTTVAKNRKKGGMQFEISLSMVKSQKKSWLQQ